MAEERGAEAKDEKTLNIDGGGKPLNAEEYDKDSDARETTKNGDVVVTGRKLVAKKRSYEFTPSSLSCDCFHNKDFGRDTSRLDLISFRYFDVYGENPDMGKGSYGGGGGRKDSGMTQQVTVVSYNGDVVQGSMKEGSGDGGEPVSHKLEQEKCNIDVKPVIKRSQEKKGSGGADVDGDQDGGCMVAVGCGETWLWSWVCGKKSFK